MNKFECKRSKKLIEQQTLDALEYEVVQNVLLFQGSKHTYISAYGWNDRLGIGKYKRYIVSNMPHTKGYVKHFQGDIRILNENRIEVYHTTLRIIKNVENYVFNNGLVDEKI